MAAANHGLHSNVPADDEDAGPLHVPLLQSWISLSSTANLQLNPSFLLLPCSPLPLPPGKENPARLDQLQLAKTAYLPT
ncbi:hypothetical protein HO133_009417 [Letharia lupina]|uniref:Uncharacterized protein n=1 Tax=Letharia lupina TaxID=560253 RepID=A0A8H6FFU3_9LECA|nr:uncharacterized protein HO133_009417 [Letharia lupina]KAF6226551.1 hypothetical protein HO133_009417 [Letharia lupina]